MLRREGKSCWIGFGVVLRVVERWIYGCFSLDIWKKLLAVLSFESNHARRTRCEAKFQLCLDWWFGEGGH